MDCIPASFKGRCQLGVLPLISSFFSNLIIIYCSEGALLKSEKLLYRMKKLRSNIFQQPNYSSSNIIIRKFAHLQAVYKEIFFRWNSYIFQKLI